jgi:gentisate 1,2-dioxygenase
LWLSSQPHPPGSDAACSLPCLFRPVLRRRADTDQPLDISAALGCQSPATSPALCANFIRIVKGSVMTTAEATSQLFFVYRGVGRTDACGESIYWRKGDYLVLPAHGQAMHCSEGEARLYWVHDTPLLRYLGVSPSVERFKPTLFEFSKAETKLESIANDPVNSKANRVSVLLANKNFPQTRTVTHTLWAMFGLLPAGKIQYPHRHESVALDFVVDCKNLRTLEITFSHPGHDHTAHISQMP